MPFQSFTKIFLLGPLSPLYFWDDPPLDSHFFLIPPLNPTSPPPYFIKNERSLMAKIKLPKNPLNTVIF